MNDPIIDIRLKSSYATEQAEWVTIWEPMLALYLLMHGCGFNDEVYYKCIILPTIKREFAKFSRIPKLPCKEEPIQFQPMGPLTIDETMGLLESQGLNPAAAEIFGKWDEYVNAQYEED